MAKKLRTTELDFDTIKANLKTFLKNQEQFTDYDFEGSGLNVILDVLAYTTHYNAVNANLALNETFLDSSRLRASIVSHAKLLGYTPRSSFAPVAVVDVKIINPVNVTDNAGNFLTLTMPRGTEFTTTFENKSYTFITESTVSTVVNADGDYIFEDVRLLQGKLVTTQYIYDTTTSEKFILPYDKAVTSTLAVSIRENRTSTEITPFTLAANIATINEESEVYFLQEGREGYYEVYFGDGVLGKALQDGNIISLEYVITDGEEANGSNIFSLADSINGNVNAEVTTVTKAAGGADPEDINSIKFNAPLGFVAQNRAVTPDDYKAIIQNSFSNIEAISVWGGEDSDPPDYGKVFISIKPKDGESLSVTDREFIKAQILKPKNVISITPEIVDPTFTYLSLEVFFKYNPNLTDLTLSALTEVVRTAIRDYNTNELKRFDGVFRYSNILNTIDQCEPSIVNSFVRVYMNKRFIPDLTKEVKYEIVFSSPIYITSSNEQIIDSSNFIYNGQTCRFEDQFDVNTGERRIQIVSGRGENKFIVSANEGIVDGVNGKIILNGFKPDSIIGDYINLQAQPNSNDIAPKRNELLEILVEGALIYGEVDTMITGGTSAGVNYTTTPRHK